MSDIECPYCKHEQEVCHDDGEGYADDETHQMECYKCDKVFVFTTGIIFCYTPSKADCLNGGEHAWEPTATSPKQCTRMMCRDCDERRTPTADEMQEVMVGGKL